MTTKISEICLTPELIALTVLGVWHLYVCWKNRIFEDSDFIVRIYWGVVQFVKQILIMFIPFYMIAMCIFLFTIYFVKFLMFLNLI